MANPKGTLFQRWLEWFSLLKMRERRQAKRFRCNLGTSCYLIASLEGGSPVIRVRNISAGGISLVHDRGFDPQTVLTIELSNEHQNFTCRLKVRIAYSLEHPSGDWILGGAFTRKLTDSELKALLFNPKGIQLDRSQKSK